MAIFRQLSEPKRSRATKAMSAIRADLRDYFALTDLPVAARFSQA
jgi:hypothetical protein